MVRVKAITVRQLGGPHVLRWEEVPIGDPKEGQVRVRNKAIGLNYVDIYLRNGVYRAPRIPFTPGVEAVGVVIAVGNGVTDTKVGDVVGYAGRPLGSYAEEQIVPVNYLVPVPPSVHPNLGAAILAKGMTAHYLLRRCFKVEPGHTILVHAAAAGAGSLLCQWANNLGATVIGTVYNIVEADQAREDGCHHVIICTKEDFVARVKEITSGIGVDVVYDSVGKDTFEVVPRSLACLKLRGYMVNYGHSSGLPDPVPLPSLGKKSLFLTRATLMHSNVTRDERLEAAGEVFANVASGVLNVRVNHTYPLSEAAQAHRDLENGKTSGSIVQPGHLILVHEADGAVGSLLCPWANSLGAT
ncbi:2-haloacrylate reductase, partial [Mucuna pruriens]